MIRRSALAGRREAVDAVPNALVVGFPRTATRSPRLSAVEPPPPRSYLTNVQWSVAFVAFVVYVFVITTYRVPIATLAMVSTLGALPLEKRGLRFPSLVLWCVALLCWASLGLATSTRQDIVWDHVIEFGKVCLITFAALNVLRTRARFRLFLVLFLLFFVLYPVRGAFFNYFIYGETLAGRALWNNIYSNPNDLAGFCLLQLSIAAGLLCTERGRTTRLALGAAMVVLALLTIMTQSRGAFIGLAAVLVFALRAERRRLRLIGFGLVGIGVIVLVAPDRAWRRLSTLQDVASTQQLDLAEDEGSAQQRYEIWKVAATITQENPITGAGLGTYPLVHDLYSKRSQFRSMARGFRDTHSTYLNLSAELGIPGLLLFLGMVLTPLVAAEKTRRRARSTRPKAAMQLFYLELGLASYLVAGIFGSYGMLVFTYLHLALLVVATQVLALDLRGSAVRRPPRTARGLR